MAGKSVSDDKVYEINMIASMFATNKSSCLERN